MMRAQQQNRSNENKSTFERRPSQRFASRRSRMDRTRPNITSSSSASTNKNNTNNSNNNNPHSDSNNSTANNIENNSQANQSKPAINDAPQRPAKPNIVINSGAPRNPILQSKPVKPPTVPPGASYGITQTKPNGQQPVVSINNNNIHHYLKDRQLTEFSDCANVSATTPSQTSQPNMSVKSHHYINYKPPNSQPPPPPPPKLFDNKAHREQARAITSEEEQQTAEASTVPARKPSRLSCSFSSEQHPESSHPNGSIHKHQQGEVINSSSMPPPPPPPSTMPRSASNQANKQSAHHSQASIIKPICVTEL